MSTTLTDKTILLSKKGMKELKKSISNLERDLQKARQSLRELDRTTKRDERMDRIEKLSLLESIETELSDKRLTLASAKFLPTKRARLQVAIGSVVDLIDQQGRLFHYTIVDSIEANPSDGRISIASPLGKSLVGKTVRDFVDWSTTSMRANRLQLIRIM
ncbi:GreA/GreB family elongation factor [Candidatus Saccharibacteria bacterium]|nr:GreA/GreB family elongation factor [Candidatus Saccharibacteria bacterium]